MNNPRSCPPREPAFHFGTVLAVATNRLRDFCGGLLVLAVLSSSFPLMAAQNGAARAHAAEIQDHFQKAFEYLKANDTNSALQEFNAVLALDPKNAEALANRGAVRLFDGDCRDASQDFQSALAIDPSLLKPKAMLGICENRLGRSSGKALLESVYPKLKEKDLRMQVGMELAGLYYQQGDMDRTTNMIQSLLQTDPDNVDVLYFAQLVYTEMADDTLNKLTILAPGSARVQQVIAEHLVNDGDLSDAIVHYKNCLAMNPRMPGVRYELAEAIIEALPSDPAARSDAQKELETTIQIEGDSAGIEAVLGRIALLQADTQGAYAHYQRSLAFNPGSVDAQIGMGRVLTLLGKPADALKYLRLAVQADPLNTEAHYRLIIVYRKLNLTDEAAKEAKLFEEVKQAKQQVTDIYREMNKRPQSNGDEDEDQTPSAPQ
jgi:tetratricopeptide (TPR) repeat protein